MSHNHPTITNYNLADTFLGNKQSRPLHGRNTMIGRNNDSSISIMYHYTRIVTYYPNGFTVDNGGYDTVTTKRKIVEYTGINLFQRNFVWYTGNMLFEKINGNRALIDYNTLCVIAYRTVQYGYQCSYVGAWQYVKDNN